jgi:hypothetical protein
MMPGNSTHGVKNARMSAPSFFFENVGDNPAWVMQRPVQRKKTTRRGFRWAP